MNTLTKRIGAELGAVVLATSLIGGVLLFATSDAIATTKAESYRIHDYNVDKEKLLRFNMVSEADNEAKNPNEKKLEKELTLSIEKDGKTKKVTFSNLNIRIDDIPEMRLRLAPDEELDKANGTLVIPAKDVQYE